MNKAGELIITESFNGLLSRMAELDHLGILMEGSKILKNAKRQNIEPTMQMSDVMQSTGLRREDLDFFISLRLIEVVQPADDPVISFRYVHCLVRIFSRCSNDGGCKARGMVCGAGGAKPSTGSISCSADVVGPAKSRPLLSGYLHRILQYCIGLPAGDAGVSPPRRERGRSLLNTPGEHGISVLACLAPGNSGRVTKFTESGSAV